MHAVYADFTCPLAYLASQRLDALGSLVGDDEPPVGWRAVGHRATLPRAGLRLDPAGLDGRQAELDALRPHLLPGETLPQHAPRLLPHPAAPTAAYAEAITTGVGAAVRRALLQAYWEEGQDIGDPEVLRRLLPATLATSRTKSDPVRDFGYAVSSQRSPVTGEAYRLMRRWQQDWHALGGPVSLTLVGEGRAWAGEEALRALPDLPALAAPVV